MVEVCFLHSFLVSRSIYTAKYPVPLLLALLLTGHAHTDSMKGDHRGGRGGGRGAHGSGPGGEREKPKKENILDLGKYMDKKITVKFTGGREGWLNPSTAESA